MGGKDEAVGVDEGNRELTTQLSRFSFHVPAHSCDVLVLVNEDNDVFCEKKVHFCISYTLH